MVSDEAKQSQVISQGNNDLGRENSCFLERDGKDKRRYRQFVRYLIVVSICGKLSNSHHRSLGSAYFSILFSSHLSSFIYRVLDAFLRASKFLDSNMGKTGDYAAVRKDIVKLLHQPEYDDGSAGPVLVRLAWHASGTYDVETDTGGSNGAGMLRMEVLMMLRF